MFKYTQPLMVATAALVALPFASCESPAEARIRIVEEMAESLDEVAKILKDVKDKSSADDAADDLADVLDDLKDLKEEMDDLGELDDEARAELEKMKDKQQAAGLKLMTSLFAAAGSMQSVAMKDYYGSSELEKVCKEIKDIDLK